MNIYATTYQRSAEPFYAKVDRAERVIHLHGPMYLYLDEEAARALLQTLTDALAALPASDDLIRIPAPEAIHV